jgi:REP element-mobilizing transposase RayT
MRLNAQGLIVQAAWLDLPQHFPSTEVDALVVMPNHVHGILILHDPVGAKHRSCREARRHAGARRHASPLPPTGEPRGTSPGSLPAVVQAIKSASARRINLLRGTPAAPVWQRGYYEYVIRAPDELDRVRRYIESNPLRWTVDRENPVNA